MDHFRYRAGRLHAEDVAVDRIAREVGTPCYIYSTATLERHFRVFADAVAGLDALVCFAVKANGNLAVIRTLASLGAGADVVSGGEMRRALAAGVPASRIVFSGVGKTRAEIAAALKAGVHQINVESEPELDRVAEVAAGMGRTAEIAFRVNPDVDARTHAKITTGKRENKFGIEMGRIRQVVSGAARKPGVKVVGLALHIGSQLVDLAPFREAFEKTRTLFEGLRRDGHPLTRFDVGGGLGIPYGDHETPLPAEYGKVVRETLGGLGCQIILEPGRVIVGNAGILVSEVLYVKEGATRNFLIVDAAMNDLIRPALYDAAHTIVPVNEPAELAPRAPVDVVGPICETGDTFAVQRPLPPLAAGDLVAFRSVGAYGAAMSSMYNARALAPEVLVHGREFAVVRERITVDDMMSRETVPPWLEVPA